MLLSLKSNLDIPHTQTFINIDYYITIMRESTGRAMRIDKLREIVKELTKRGDYAIEKKLIAQLSLSWNVSMRKVKEYITLLIDAEEFIKTPEGIKFNGD